MRCKQELFPNEVEGQTKQSLTYSLLIYSLSVFSVFVPTSPIDFNTSGTIVWHQFQFSDIPIRFFGGGFYVPWLSAIFYTVPYENAGYNSC